MKIEWRSDSLPPYLFRQFAEWPGVTVRRARVHAGRMPEQTNPCHELNVALSGRISTYRLNAAGRRVVNSGGSGNICVTPAGQTVGAEWNGQLDNLGICLEPKFVERTAAENHFAGNFEFVEVYKATDPLIAQIGLALLDESRSDAPEGRLFSDSLIQTLTLHVLRSYTTATIRSVASGGISGHRLRRVEEFIDANLDGELSLADIAAVAELSQFHFAREFRKATGRTPQQFVTERRIERAKALLARPELPIVEVGLRTGFKNQSHFTTLFRKFTKFTPKAWRELTV